MDTKTLHLIIYPSCTLDAVYVEHWWKPALLGKTLRTLGVSESDTADLSELDWSYAADRIARERVQQGWPVHRQNVLLEMLTAYTDVSYDILQIERNLVQALEKLGVEPAVTMWLLAGKNCIYLLADRLALELERLGHKADCQTAVQMRHHKKIAALAPAPEPHA